MTNTLARISTGKGKYVLQPLFCVLNKLGKMRAFTGHKVPKNIKINSLKSNQSSTKVHAYLVSRQHDINSTPSHRKVRYNTCRLSTDDTRRAQHLRRQAHKATVGQSNNSLHHRSPDQTCRKLAPDNTCIGWESVHRSRGTQREEAHIVKQYSRCSTKSDNSKPSAAPHSLIEQRSNFSHKLSSLRRSKATAAILPTKKIVFAKERQRQSNLRVAFLVIGT